MPVFDARSNVYVAIHLAIKKKNHRPIWGFPAPHPYFRTPHHCQFSVSCRESTPPRWRCWGSDGGERSDAHCRSRQASNEGYSVIEIYERSRGILAGL